MLINEVILDSNTETPPSIKKKKVIRVRKQRIVRTNSPTKQIEGQQENQINKIPQKPKKAEEKPIILPFPKRDGVRFVDNAEVNQNMQNFSRKFCKKDLITSTILRKKVRKANGTRIYFTFKSQSTLKPYIAKAKYDSSNNIPICIGEEIHLSSSKFDAHLISQKKQTSFTLVTDNDTPIITVQFTLSRTIFDGARKMSVFIYPNDEQNQRVPLPLDLVSKNTTTMPQFGSLFRMISVKNAFLGPLNDDICLISIRKTGTDEIKIDSLLDLTDFQIFAIGIASFLGKTP